MGLINWIKKLVSKPEPKFPVNFTKVFDSFEVFMNYVIGTTDFDRHYVYYYMGDAKSLASIISGDEFYGEKAVPDLSLHYVGECTKVKNNLLLTDVLFFPDQVFDLKNKYASIDRSKEVKCLYRSDNNGMFSVKGVVIASENVYLCNK